MKNIIISSIVILFYLPLVAQVDRTKVPEPGPAPKIELGNYESFTLKNGLKVFVVEHRKLPKVSFSLIIDKDPTLEGENAGYVSMAGQMLQRGTKNRTKDQLDEEIDFIGATLSTSSNSIYGSSLKKHSDKLVELMADVLLNPSFPEAELEKIKKQTISGLAAQKDNPNAIASKVAQILVYGKDHPYGEPTTEETVETINIEMINQYYKTYFKPNISYLAIVGDINKKEAEKLVNKYLSKWEKGDVPKHEYKEPALPETTKIAIVDRPASVQSIINVTYPVVLKPSSPDVIKARVTNHILGGDASARLQMNLREARGFTYGSYSSLSTDKLVGRFNASASVRNAVTDSATIEIINELKKIKSEKATEEELDLVKNNITGNFARSLESPQTIASFALNIERYKLPKDYYANYLKNLAEVSLNDVQEMSSKYIKPENSYVVVVGKADDISENLKKIGEIEFFDIYGEKYSREEASKIPAGLTGEMVIENYLKAVGGKEKIKALQDVKISAKANAMGRDVELTNATKGVDKSLQSLSMGGMELQKAVISGNKAAMFQQGQAMPLDETMVKEMVASAGIFPELRYPEAGVKTNLKGLERMENKDVYIVEVLMPTGKTSLHYFDKDSGLKVMETQKVETPQGEMTLSTEFSNYKEVNEIKFPHTIMVPLGGPEKMKAEVTSIEINKGLKDDLFKLN
ncbi:MAG: insulinase family protein [Bacteroidota bacterium]|nr:insulinase family protein [Bacteroidota bacterium]